MQIVLSNEWHIVIRFDRDDDVLAGILDLAAHESLTAAWLSAIGSTQEIELGFYDRSAQEYVTSVFAEELELVEASGTLSIASGKPHLHLHGFFGRRDFQTIGGHIHHMIANSTLEVFIHKITGQLTRTHDAATGLTLLSR